MLKNEPSIEFLVEIKEILKRVCCNDCRAKLIEEYSKNVFGAKRTIIITYNEATFRRQNGSFERQMNRVMTEAKAYFETVAKEPTSQVQARMETFLKTQKIATSQALRFYECKVYHNGWVNRLTLRRKRSEVALKKSTFGKKILFSSLLEETTENILDYYKGAYQIEDTFYLIKDRDMVPYVPAYHWTDSKIRVNAFGCILALLLLRFLYCVAKENDICMSPKLLVEELQDITMVVMVYSVKKAVTMVSSRSTVQQRLFDLYDLQKYAPSG